MNWADNEMNVIEYFLKNFMTEDTALFPSESLILEKLLNSIVGKNNFEKYWENSSGKDQLPPDFYSEKYKFMMEMMRVDDHAYENEDGKIINPVNIKESKSQKELKEKGLLNAFPNVDVIVNAVTDLPSEKDHNYEFYYKNFIRAVGNHINKIKKYRNNHPNYKLIFFIFDESSAYVETKEEIKNKYAGLELQCSPHDFFLDKRFIDIFKNSDIDYLIWYAPYKNIEIFSTDKCSLPQTIVYDIKNFEDDGIEYDEKLITSLEE